VKLLPIIVIAVLLVGVQGAVSVGMARADYTVTWCQNSATNPPFTNGGSGAEPWAAIRYECGSKTPVVELDTTSEQTINGKDEVKTEGVLKANQSYKVTMTAPKGLTISRIDTALVAEPFGGEAQPEVQVGDDGGVFFSHTYAAPWTYNVNQELPSGDSTVTIGDRCTIVLNVSCFFASQYGILTVGSLSLTLHDVEQPTLALTGGQLVLPGTQSGTQDVTFSASAHDSGIADVDAYLGSTLVGSDAYQSTQCSYARFEPCPQTVSDELAVDTTKVPDGTYPLTLEASDASGNVVSVTSKEPVVVSNDVSPSGAPDATSATASPSPSGPGAPNGRGAATTAEIAYLSGEHGKITVSDGQGTSVSGRLTSQTGTPIAGASVDVLSQTIGSNMPFALIGHATTDASGVYTFQVPPGPSRAIRTGYRAFANDSGYDATADLTESVTATTSLKVTPSRLRGRTFTFYGQVQAGSFPSGQQVEIKALVGSTWTHVTFAPVASNGQFKVRYRLKHHYRHVTFVFRATPVPSPIWPYEPKESNLARLRLL
jgi:hypothetical protein